MLRGWRQESVYTKPEDRVWASPHKQGSDLFWPQMIMRRFVQPTAAAVDIKKRIGWRTFHHTFSTLIKSLGVDANVVQELMRHASFRPRWADTLRPSMNRSVKRKNAWQT